MKRTITYVSSAAALIVAAPLALAQQKPNNGGPPQAPSPTMQKDAGAPERGQQGAAQRNEPAGVNSRKQPGSEADAQSGGAEKQQGKQARDGAKEQRKEAKDEAREQRKDARSKSQEKRKDAQENARENRQKTPEQRVKSEDQDDDNTKGAKGSRDPQQNDQAAGSDQDRQPDTDQAQGAGQDETQQDQATDGNSQQSTGNVRAEDRKKAEQVRSKIDHQKRQRVRDVAFSRDVRRAQDVDVRIDVGVRLPRRVDVYPIPAAIIEIAPAYRSYHYIVVGDSYCIVDPETYVIVDVIHRGGADRGQYASGSGGPRLELTNDQIEIIRREVRDRGRVFDYEGDLEVGITLPGDFLFEPFPDNVIREVPAVRQYRFIRIEDEIAIVDPDQPEVVFVIES